MGKLLTTAEAFKKANILRAKLTRYERAFARNYPHLISYVTGARHLDECASGYYRDKIKAHIRTMAAIEKEANRLEEFASRQRSLF